MRYLNTWKIKTLLGKGDLGISETWGENLAQYGDYLDSNTIRSVDEEFEVSFSSYCATPTWVNQALHETYHYDRA